MSKRLKKQTFTSLLSIIINRHDNHKKEIKGSSQFQSDCETPALKIKQTQPHEFKLDIITRWIRHLESRQNEVERKINEKFTNGNKGKIHPGNGEICPHERVQQACPYREGHRCFLPRPSELYKQVEKPNPNDHEIDED